MSRLYPPVTEEVLSAFCLNYNTKGEKTGASINIDFSLNRAIATSEISGMVLRLRTISTNQYIITENISNNVELKRSEGQAVSYNLNEGICTFQITDTYNSSVVNKLKVGQHYKAQIAFIDLNGVIGYWSTVSTIKCVARPTVSIANFNQNDANMFTNEIIGEYIQDTSTGDSSEKVYSYSFILSDSVGNVIEETGTQLHNSSSDISSNSSTDTFYCYKQLNEDEIYYLEYVVTTVNGLTVSSPRYQIINAASVDPEQNIGLFARVMSEDSSSWSPWEEGVVELYLDYNYINAREQEKRLTGNFIILRSSSRDNFKSWQEVRRFRLNNAIPSQKRFYDYTVEQGVAYRYAFQQFNRQGFYSKKVYCYERDNNQSILEKNGEPIIAEVKTNFEDMFLYDGERQLKIRFNPKVSSFKNDLQEQKIDTIGSKHPFIFRNGNVCYKEFPISGLISFQQDNALFFISKNDSLDTDDYRQMELDRFEIPSNETQLRTGSNFVYEKVTDFSSINFNKEKYYKKISSNTYEQFISRIDLATAVNSKQDIYIHVHVNEPIYREETYNKTDLTSDNIATERYFKLAVLNWLTDGKPKLFRSPTEGNYIVRLLNVSLSPEDKLGRMLHTFTCTAYEIADFDYASLLELGLLKVTDPQETEYQWYAYNIKNLLSLELGEEDSNGDQYYTIDLENKELYGFQCVGFAPGDKIKIIVSDNAVPTVITIGQTGSYVYEDSKNIISLSVCPQSNTDGLPRSLLLAAKGYNIQQFDTIASISTYTQLGQQIVGKMDNFFEPNVVNTGHDVYDSLYAKNFQKDRVQSYWKGNNLYLTEDFEIVDIDEETYNNDWYYVFKNGKYQLPLREESSKQQYAKGEKEPFNKDYIYYKRIFGAPKLKVSEILYLHAKKRQIIPIFASSSTGYIEAIGDEEKSDMIFSLTPFGNGFIRYKSIALPAADFVPPKGSSYNLNWEYLWDYFYGKLTEEERTKAYSTGDLVDLIMDQSHKKALDKFCLFQVYLPNNNNGVIMWEPATMSDNTRLNIFDPYLYQTQIKKYGEDVAAPGWWQKKENSIEEYDPTFTIKYGEGQAQISETISLAEKDEITLKNIKVPNYLSTGTGVIIDLIYRVEYTDYSIESENSEIKSLKNEYFEIKNDAEKKMALYRSSLYSQIAGQALYEKYSQLMAKIKNYENYKSAIKLLTESARQEQQNQIRKYLKEESSLINQILLRARNVDVSLKENLGDEYNNSSYSRWFDVLTNYKTNYDNYIQTTNKTTDLLLPIDYYERGSFSSFDLIESYIIEEVNNYLNHIQNDNSTDFFSTLGSTLNNFDIAIREIETEISDLGTNRYVSQYLEYLQNKGAALFFDTVSSKYYIENEKGEFVNQYRLGDLINKKDISTLSPFVDITSKVWNDYFHIEDKNDIVFLRLEQKQVTTGTTTKTEYSIQNLEYFDGKVELSEKDTDPPKNPADIFNKDSSILLSRAVIYDNKTEAMSILSLLTTSLDELNNLGDSSGTITEYETRWEVQYSSIEPDGFSLIGNNKLELGRIEDNSTIQKTWLELIIDTGFINNKLTSESSILDITSYLASQDEITSLPSSIQEVLYEIIENYIKFGVREKFEKAYSTYSYWQENKNSLTEQQTLIAQSSIQNIKEDMENTSIGDKTWGSFYGEAAGDLNELLDAWKQDYDNVHDNTKGVLASRLKNYIDDFNQILYIKKQAIEDFNAIRNKILALKEDPSISVSDDIKTILREKEELYKDAKDEIQTILDYLTNQYNLLHKKYQYDAYYKYLISYLQTNQSGNPETMSAATCNQYLVEAEVMKNTVVNNDYEPYHQLEIIYNGWRKFIDKLAEVYNKEIKGRFS